MTWSNGRQLDSTNVGGMNLSYSYNADGQRTSKSRSAYYTDEYVYYGTQLSTLIRSGVGYKHSLTFIYDDAGQALGFYYDTNLNDSNPGTKYYYVCNAQGDVLQLRDHTNAPVANYYYDAWGKLLGITDANGNAITAFNSVAVLNPIRYRGYFYDTETGFYYLNSRYYDPQIGRFINADGVMGVNNEMSTYNLFVYCGNNPVARYDALGMFWKELISSVIHAGNNFAVAIGIDTAAIGAYFLMMEKDDSGVYHARQDCWQQYGGYNDLYDVVFNLATSMETVKFNFSYNGSAYTIWAWKGDYINLGAGAELAIYRGSSGHRTVDTRLAMRMSMMVDYNGEQIINYFPSEKQWWITGFNPKYQNVKANDLTVTFGIQFNSIGMYRAFKNQRHVYLSWCFIDYLNLAILQF